MIAAVAAHPGRPAPGPGREWRAGLPCLSGPGRTLLAPGLPDLDRQASVPAQVRCRLRTAAFGRTLVGPWPAAGRRESSEYCSCLCCGVGLSSLSLATGRETQADFACCFASGE